MLFLERYQQQESSFHQLLFKVNCAIIPMGDITAVGSDVCLRSLNRIPNKVPTAELDIV